MGARARENTIPLAAASPFAAAPETRPSSRPPSSHRLPRPHRPRDAGSNHPASTPRSRSRAHRLASTRPRRLSPPPRPPPRPSFSPPREATRREDLAPSSSRPIDRDRSRRRLRHPRARTNETNETRRDAIGSVWISKKSNRIKSRALVPRAPSSSLDGPSPSTRETMRRARRLTDPFFARDARRRRLTRHPSRLVSSRQIPPRVVVHDRAMPTSSSSDDRTAVFVRGVALGACVGACVVTLARSSRLSSFLVGPRGTSSSSRRRRDAARRDKEAYIDRLGLVPHPEGGFFVETYRTGRAPMSSRGKTATDADAAGRDDDDESTHRDRGRRDEESHDEHLLHAHERERSSVVGAE